jgi:hypothetical protein
MTSRDAALDIRATLAVWVGAGLSVAEMCRALSVPTPLGDRDAITYLTHWATRRWAEIGGLS